MLHPSISYNIILPNLIFDFIKLCYFVIFFYTVLCNVLCYDFASLLRLLLLLLVFLVPLLVGKAKQSYLQDITTTNFGSSNNTQRKCSWVSLSLRCWATSDLQSCFAEDRWVHSSFATTVQYNIYFEKNFGYVSTPQKKKSHLDKQISNDCFHPFPAPPKKEKKRPIGTEAGGDSAGLCVRGQRGPIQCPLAIHRGYRAWCCLVFAFGLVFFVFWSVFGFWIFLVVFVFWCFFGCFLELGELSFFWLTIVGLMDYLDALMLCSRVVFAANPRFWFSRNGHASKRKPLFWGFVGNHFLTRAI